MVMQLDKSAFSIGINKFLGLTEKMERNKYNKIYNENIYVRSKTKGDKNNIHVKGEFLYSKKFIYKKTGAKGVAKLEFTLLDTICNNCVKIEEASF